MSSRDDEENGSGLHSWRRPFIAVSSVVTLVVASSADVLVVALESADLIFPMLSVVYGSIAENVEWIPMGTLRTLLIFFATLYVAQLGSKIYERWKNDN